MKLFELDDLYNVNFNPEIFLIKDFAELKASRKKNTPLLFKEMAYIFFFQDLKSDFQFQTNLDNRKEEIKKYVKLPDKWEPDTILIECMRVYKYLSQTASSKLLESAYIAVDKLQEHIQSLNLNERTQSGSPVWNPKLISDIVKTIPDLLKSIKQAESEYLKDQDVNDKLRADKIKTLYEDGLVRKQ